MVHIFQEKTGQAAVTAYASLLKARIVGRTNASVILSNTGIAGHTIKWKILVSNDPQGETNSWAEDASEATLTAGSTARHCLTGNFCWIDCQIASNDAGESGEGNCWLMACGV